MRSGGKVKGLTYGLVVSHVGKIKYYLNCTILLNILYTNVYKRMQLYADLGRFSD